MRIDNPVTPARYSAAGTAAHLLLILGLCGAIRADAAEKAFTLAGATLSLTEVTGETDVHFRSMRLNRALNEWNVEVSVSNRSSTMVQSPLVLLVESYSGTSGPLRPDGMDDSSPPKAFYEMSRAVPNGLLPSGQESSTRTIALGIANSSPTLNVRVFARPPPKGFALALTRSLDSIGQPLPGVTVEEFGPGGSRTHHTDPRFGIASLGGGAGLHNWKFSAPDYLPVWRSHTLGTGSVSLLHYPRLTRRATNLVTLTPIGGGSLSASNIQVEFPPASVSSPAPATLTPITAQALPALLPLGWSPVSGFWLESAAELSLPGRLRIQLPELLRDEDRSALVRWDTVNLRWRVLSAYTGISTNELVTALPGTGAYALVVADTGVLAPAFPEAGEWLQPTPSLAAQPELVAGGWVDPPSSPASRDPERVTATAAITITNQTGPLPSGLVVTAEIRDEYLLSDATRRHPPQYEQFVVGYQRPGDRDPVTVQAQVPLRPLFLFGPDELESAAVKLILLEPVEGFLGTVFDASGGLLSHQGIRVLAGVNTFRTPQAGRLRRLASTNFVDFQTNGVSILAGFELLLAGVESGSRLALQVDGLPANRSLVLARVEYLGGFYGLQPLERLRTDANGNLQTSEPVAGDRLDGLAGPGQYVLVEVPAAQALVIGQASDAQGGPSVRVPVVTKGQPWLALTDTNGAFKLLAPAGPAELLVHNPLTGDQGQTAVDVSDPLDPVLAQINTVQTGPTVIGIAPELGAKNVPRVASIVIRFSEPVNPASLLVGGLQVFGANNQNVEGSLNLNLRGDLATFLPASPLAPSTLHTIRLSTNISDVSGLRLAGPAQFTFTTETDALSRLGAQLTIYEPTNGIAGILGSPGSAEPGSPVILVNETTGETTTVLSREDGSFTNNIPAGIDDFISAVLINRNGTRTTLPASRQIFRDGSVGLFKAGGILEAESDGGPVQVLIEPGAINEKTRFKLETLRLDELLPLIGNTLPENAQLLGGIRFSAEGDELKIPADVEFPVNASQLDLAPGESPTNRTFALCEPVTIGGVTVYSVIDRMHYEDGKLVTRSPPFPGLGATAAGTFLAVPIMMAFGTQLAIHGQVVSVSEAAGAITEDEIRAGVAVRGGMIFPVSRLAGAVVSASPQQVVNLQTPSLRPGAIVSRANRVGFYATLFPVNSLVPDAILMRAVHPRFPGVEGRTPLVPPAGNEFQAGAVANIVLRYPGSSAYSDQVPPLMTLTQPGALQLHVPETVQFNIRDDFSEPSLLSVNIDFAGSRAVLPNRVLFGSEAGLSTQSPVSTGSRSIRVPVEFLVSTAAVVAVEAVIADAAGNQATNRVSLRFGIAPPASGTNIVPADPDDTWGPEITSVNPVRDGVISHGQMLLRFNEPVDLAIINNLSALTIAPQVETLRRLSPNQRELLLQFVGLKPDTTYEVTINSGQIRDVAGNVMSSSYSTRFKTPPVIVSSLPDIENAAATLSLGAVNFTLDRLQRDGFLTAHLPLASGSAPLKLGSLSLPPYPRAMALVPNYSFKRNPSGPVETRSLIIACGGLLGLDNVGQWVWAIDVTNPTNMARVASQLGSVDPASAFTAIKWSPPRLGVLETRSEGSVIHHVNLQAFILGSNGTVSNRYDGGLDANGNGDYVDPGDRLPTPERLTFYGDEYTTIAPAQRILADFAMAAGGAFEVGTVSSRGTAPSFLQVFVAQGLPLDLESGEGRVEFPPGSNNSQARRVELDLAFPLADDTGVRTIPAAIVAIDQELRIFDLSDPLLPVPVRTNQLGTAAENILGLARVGQDEYAVGTSSGLFLLSRTIMGGTNGLTLAVTEHFPEVPMSGRVFAVNDAFVSASYGGVARVQVRAPRIRVVRVDPFPVLPIGGLLSSNRQFKVDFVAAAQESGFLLPVPLTRCQDIQSELATNAVPNPLFNHYPMVVGHGEFGAELLVAVESLDLGMNLNIPRGEDFPPILLSQHAGAFNFGSMHPEVVALRLKRLSHSPTDPLFNVFVGSPFLVVLEPLNESQQAVLEQVQGRAALWGGHFVRLSFDPPNNGAPPLSQYLGKVEDKQYKPALSRTYRSFPGEYIDTPNPSFPKAAPRFAGVDLQSGEFSHPETDILIQGRHQDLVLTRVYQSRSRYMGPFGRGWDFNYNARLLELPEDDLPAGYAFGLLDRGDGCNRAEACDVLFIDGAGSVMVFRCIRPGNTNLSAYAQDPAVTEFLGLNGSGKISQYYESPPGVFTVLYKLSDSKFMMVMPNGSRIHFLPDGRLDRAVGVFDRSVVQCIYGEDGKLTEVEGDRGIKLEFGYYKTFPSSAFGLNDVPANGAHDLGKIARIRANPSTANKSDVEYQYDLDGNLERVEPETAAPTVYRWSDQNPHEMLGMGRGDGTEMPGESITYSDGLVTGISQNGDSITYSGAVKTARDRFLAGNSTVSATFGTGGATIKIDNRGRPAEFANRPYQADDQDRPTRVAEVYSDATIEYDDSNPVYRFRGNVLATREGPAVGGQFVTKFEYDNSAWNRVKSLTDVNGVSTSYDYSALNYSSGGETVEVQGPVTRRSRQNDYGQPEEETLNDTAAGAAVPLQRTFVYSGASLGPDGGLSIGQQAPGLNAATRNRDTLGRLEMFEQGGLQYIVTYNSDSQPEKFQASGGLLPDTVITYRDGLIETETIQSGAQRIKLTYTYDQLFKGQVKSLTREETGLPTSVINYSYDDQGRPETVEMDGESMELTPNSVMVQKLTAPGLERSVTYGAGGLPQSITEQGLEATLTYDAVGRVETVTQQGATTQYTYDDQGTLSRRFKKKEILVGGSAISSQEFTYDGAGRVKTSVSQSGRSRDFDYFADGGLRSMKINGTTVREISRNAAGLVTSARLNEFSYNFSSFDPDTGQPLSETLTLQPGGRSLTRQNTHDARGRLRTVTLGGTGISYNYDYDGFNNLTLSRDPDSVSHEQTSSPGGKLLTVKFGDGGSVQYHYDVHRRVDFVSGGSGVMDFDYDADGRVRKVTFPDGTSTEYLQRNGFGEADEVRHGGLSQNHTWSDGRLQAIEVPVTGDTVEYSYDGLGRRTVIARNDSETFFGYNEDGDLSAETNSLPTGTYAWTAEINALGHVVTETYPSQLVLAFAPDNFGYPQSLSAVGIQNVTWVGGGLIESFRLAAGLKVIRHYDGALRLNSIEYEVNGNTNAGFTYTLTPGGRVLTEFRRHEGRFDVFNRAASSQAMRITNFLFSATNNIGGGALAGVRGLSFSAFGETLGAAATFGGDPRGFHPSVTESGGRLVEADGLAIGYDESGSVTNVPLWIYLPGQTTLTRVGATLVYDGLGMLRMVRREDGVDVAYTRDGLGRIVQRVVTGVPGRSLASTNEYFWQGNRLLEEREELGGVALFRRYLYLGKYLVLVQVAPAAAGPFTNYVPMITLNGSVGGYLRPNGELVETILYSAYGTPVVAGGDDRSRSRVANTLLFHGAFFDEATGLYQMGQRNLHPQLGRFLQRDNHLFRESTAMFAAFNGDPVGRVDPFGTESQESFHDQLWSFKDAAKDLYGAGQGLQKALHDFRMDMQREDEALGTAAADFVLKSAALAALAGDEHTQYAVKEITSLYDATKKNFDSGLSIAKAVGQLQNDRELLGAIKAAAFGRPQSGSSYFKGLFEVGAGVDGHTLQELNERFGENPLYQRARNKPTSLEREALIREAKRDYINKREGHALSIAKGVHSLAGAYLEKALKGNESYEASVSRQMLATSGKLLDLAEAAKKAQDARELGAIRLAYGGRGAVKFSQFLDKDGLAPLQASFQFGFEAGKLGIIALSDPDVAKAYEEQLKQFEDNGGWLTTASGLLSTFGAYDTAHLIQSIHDYNYTAQVGLAYEQWKNYRETRERRSLYYWIGTSAP